MPLLNPNQAVYFLTKKQLFRERKWKRKAHPIYLKTCTFFGATLIDRTETLETGIPFKVLDSLSKLSYTEQTFSKICTERAQSLVLASSKSIRVLWSGGIDSTVALIALWNELQSVNQIHRLKILLSQDSIVEFPTFYRDVIENKLDVRFIKTTIYDDIDLDEINVTGEHGDQLFGSDKLKYAVQTKEAYRRYEDVLDYYISRKLGTERYTSSIIDYLEPQIKFAPFEIKTYYDYLWWMNFSLKWQNVSLRLIHGLGMTHEDLNVKLFHFFQSQAFQNWSISNHDKKIQSTWESYKYIAKEYIYAFHKDENYLKFKEKEPSLKEVIVDKNRHTHFFNLKRFLK